ncbi:MAG: outer membrane beta-barrel protein [Sphingomicrobium sp.]
MRNYLLAAVAAAAIATPAVAQDAGPYVGIEGGILFPKDTNVDADVNFVDPLFPDTVNDNLIEVDYKRGYDIDAIAGYDFGAFRVEAELGYKRAKVDELQLDQDFIDDFEDATGEIITDTDFDLNGRARVTSIMGNALADFGAGGFRVYGGAGFGRARIKLLGDKDSAWAYQLIAGVGVPISQNIEVGLKYRYFRTGKLNFSEDFSDTDADISFTNNSRFSSHSLLASLIFGFGAPAEAPYIAPVMAAPPPPPMAPATQTCPDGSVILATDICPMAPPPPPPPPPAPERG